MWHLNYLNVVVLVGFINTVFRAIILGGQQIPPSPLELILLRSKVVGAECPDLAPLRHLQRPEQPESLELFSSHVAWFSHAPSSPMLLSSCKAAARRL